LHRSPVGYRYSRKSDSAEAYYAVIKGGEGKRGGGEEEEPQRPGVFDAFIDYPGKYPLYGEC